ncbi:hypothetical protein [Flavobacterium limi]|uniref:Chaperone of endosialidase n=1 Tax=Flavobacterium limi TaxID=2045105 RepID=A0ABQ1U5H8_9FLAO|nr:hypothetical protein [Flavobacterium limi]GGF10321.1 hypothetical protein GCM10011518_19420 [Flavobacterium limi]
MKSKLLLLISMIFFNSNVNAQNTALGDNANLGGGTNNTSLGAKSGYSGTHNVAIGKQAGAVNIGNYNVFMGYRSGLQNTLGHYNVFLGQDTGNANQSGSQNVFVGTQAGKSNNASNNVFIGYVSGTANYSGSLNLFLGNESGRSNVGGSNNVFSGHEAGYKNINGNNNVFSGKESGSANINGNGNTFIGTQTGYGNTYGSLNVFLGYKAGFNNMTGSNNVFIGNTAGENETGSNRLYIDNSQTATPLIYGKFDTDQLGINTNVIPAGYTMAVKGRFITEEIKVKEYGSSGWPDFVFAKNYKLPTLTEVENYINTNGHLQNIPSACEVEENGILLGEMNAKLLQKIEELTLYIIKQEARIEKLEAAVSSK